jgi:hypothetical protein
VTPLSTLLSTDSIPWSRLSDRELAILRRVVLPISHGFSRAEVGEMLGQNESWVSARLKEIRRRIRELAAEG